MKTTTMTLAFITLTALLAAGATAHADTKTIKEASLGCTSWDAYQNAMGGVPALGCKMIDGGTKVEIDHVALLHASVCVRPEDAFACYWVPVEAIQ